ncbi:uncharacterized protein LOC144109865 [Amblyomma americanum]
MGFLHSSAKDIVRDVAEEDTMAAFRWAQDNAAAFGADYNMNPSKDLAAKFGCIVNDSDTLAACFSNASLEALLSTAKDRELRFTPEWVAYSLSLGFSERRLPIMNDVLTGADVDQPAINEMLAELLAGQRKMAEDIVDIKRFQQRVNSRFEALESRVSALESSSPTLNGDASDGAVQRQLNSLSEVVSKLVSRNDELENRSRRNNLIFHGLAEEDEETNKALFIAVTKVFIDNLHLDCPKIERYHRLGRKQEGRPRPVIVKLLDFREKTQALKNAHRLKNSGISLSEDFSAHVLLIRKKIWDATQSYRDSASKVHLRYDHVFIDSVRYNWDDVEKSLVKDSKSTPPDTAAANATAAKPPADPD